MNTSCNPSPYDELTPYRSYSYGLYGYGLSNGRLGQCGGGGGIFVVDLIPGFDPATLAADQMGDTILDDAYRTILVDDAVTGDQGSAMVSGALWHSRYRGLAARVASDDSVLLAAPELVHDPKHAPLQVENHFKLPNSILPEAQRVLGFPGDYHRRADFCMQVANRPDVGQDREVALQCAGESAYLAAVHDDRTSAQRLADDSAAVRLLQEAGGPQANAESGEALEAQATEEQTLHKNQAAQQHISEARAIFQRMVDHPPQELNGTADVSAIKRALADLDFRAGRLSQALTEYRALLPTGPKAQPTPQSQSDSGLGQQAVISNIGLILLAQTKPSAEAPPDCHRYRARCLSAKADFERAFRLDSKNPTVALNLGWVDRLLGEEKGARAELVAAVQRDPSLYPAWNDLGLLMAEKGNIDEARNDWELALRVNPQYDLAAWNLGVLDSRQGVNGVVDGQLRLADAIRRNRDLRSAGLEYRTDERIYSYFVGPNVRRGQQLGRSFSVTSTALGWLVIFGIIITAIRAALADKAVERGVERWEEHFSETVEDSRSWLHRHVLHRTEPQDRPIEADREAVTLGESRGVAVALMERDPSPGAEELGGGKTTARLWWKRFEPWLITIPAVVVVTVIVARRDSPGAEVAAAALTLLATAIAVMTHEAGHFTAARLARVSVRRAYWRAGVPLAVAMAFVPLEVNLGPYLGHEIEGEVSDSHALWVYSAGPVANLLVAIVAYALFLAEPLPGLRLLAQVELAVCGYSLLPVHPLDGKHLENHPALVLTLGAALILSSFAFLQGWL